MKGRFVSGSRGEGRLGCVLTLALVSVFIFAAVRVVPVYLDKVNFDEGMARIASKAGSEAWSNRLIIHRVRELGKARNFEIDPQQIKIVRSSPLVSNREIRIAVDFSRVVEFPGYVHTFGFQSRVSSFVGSL